MSKYKAGMIGLGTMGRNLLLNMAAHGFAVAGYDKDATKVAALNEAGKAYTVEAFGQLTDFVQSLETPRVIILLVPAGKIVDAVITELLPVLQQGDIIIDAGNSHFTDTNTRVAALQKEGLHFFGMGVSGGEEGARNGPSMMPGGDIEAYQYVQPILEAIAAKVNGEACVAYIGPGAAGHFVKMVHNGIEYALMQLIADTYEILQKGVGLDNDAIHQVFAQWNQGKLQSYLLEITAGIFTYKENGSTEFLIDKIKDEAKSKGTGKWTTQVSTELELPVPTIDMAVAMRDLSKYKSLRVSMSNAYSTNATLLPGDKTVLVEELEAAYYFSMITIYAQGMHLLGKASVDYGYQLQLEEVAKIWRGGCIIRAAFLETIMQAYKTNQTLPHLLLDEAVQAIIKSTAPVARNMVVNATAACINIPAYSNAISYFDAICTGRMSTNLIQAQRDYFGAHTYELVGQEGVFHTDWTPSS
jgi:6-phosphogluconate dehydrogenase